MNKSPWLKFLHGVIAEQGQPLFTTSEASAMVGRSIDTLRRWRQRGDMKAPSMQVEYRSVRVFLYTKEDIDELKQHAKLSFSGRRTDLE